MFDPEHQDIECPECLRQRVYLDREIGCYCMFCGHLLSVEEMLVQIAKSKRKADSPRSPGSGKTAKTPIVEIKKYRSDKTGAEHVEQKSDKQQNEENQ